MNDLRRYTDGDWREMSMMVLREARRRGDWSLVDRVLDSLDGNRAAGAEGLVESMSRMRAERVMAEYDAHLTELGADERKHLGELVELARDVLNGHDMFMHIDILSGYRDAFYGYAGWEGEIRQWHGFRVESVDGRNYEVYKDELSEVLVTMASNTLAQAWFYYGRAPGEPLNFSGYVVEDLKAGFIDNECGSDQYPETQPHSGRERIAHALQLPTATPDERARLRALRDAWEKALGGDRYAGDDELAECYDLVFDIMWRNGEHPYYGNDESEILEYLADMEA